MLRTELKAQHTQHRNCKIGTHIHRHLQGPEQTDSNVKLRHQTQFSDMCRQINTIKFCKGCGKREDFPATGVDPCPDAKFDAQGRAIHCGKSMGHRMSMDKKAVWWCKRCPSKRT